MMPKVLYYILYIEIYFKVQLPLFKATRITQMPQTIQEKNHLKKQTKRKEKHHNTHIDFLFYQYLHVD